MAEILECLTKNKDLVIIEVSEDVNPGFVKVRVDDLEIQVKATPAVFNEGPEVDIEVTVRERKETVLTN